CRAADLHLCPDQRDAPLHLRGRGPWLARGMPLGPVARPRPQRGGRRRLLRAGRGGTRVCRQGRGRRLVVTVPGSGQADRAVPVIAPGLLRAVQTYLDHLAVERGLAGNTLT